jgi:hypothetical protein
MSLAAGVSLFSLSRRMGTSLEMIDQTYGHLAPDAEAVELALLDAYDAKSPRLGSYQAAEKRSAEGRRTKNPCSGAEALFRTRTGDPLLTMEVLYQLS